MIKFEHTDVMNIKGAMRGMRNPMNSHHKQDTVDGVVGENDMNLAQRLARAGTEHRKYMRQIFVCVDITAPLYWYKEQDTYKVGTTANSTSTMHFLHRKPITMDDFSFDKLDYISKHFVEHELIPMLESLRLTFVETKDKAIWYQLIQLLPSSYNQTRTVTMSYENILNMYHQRKNHRLDEWHTFCDWALELPYFKEMGCIE